MPKYLKVTKKLSQLVTITNIFFKQMFSCFLKAGSCKLSLFASIFFPFFLFSFGFFLYSLLSFFSFLLLSSGVPPELGEILRVQLFSCTYMNTCSISVPQHHSGSCMPTSEVAVYASEMVVGRRRGRNGVG